MMKQVCKEIRRWLSSIKEESKQGVILVGNKSTFHLVHAFGKRRNHLELLWFWFRGLMNSKALETEKGSHTVSVGSVGDWIAVCVRKKLLQGMLYCFQNILCNTLIVCIPFKQ